MRVAESSDTKGWGGAGAMSVAGLMSSVSVDVVDGVLDWGGDTCEGGTLLEEVAVMCGDGHCLGKGGVGRG